MKYPLLFFLLLLVLLAKAQTPERTINDLIGQAWQKHEDPETQEEALQLAEAALEESNKIGYLKGKGDAYSIKGRVALLHQNLDQALYQYEQCILVRRQAGDSCGVGAAYTNLSSVYIEAGDYPQAIWCSQYAERILLDKIEKQDADKARAQKALGIAYERFSIIYNDRKEHLQSIKYGKLAAMLAEVLKDTVFWANSLYNLANRYYSAQSVAEISAQHQRIFRDSALFFHHKARFLFEYIEDDLMLAETDNSIASIHIDEAQYDSAWLYLNRAKERYLDVSDSSSAFFVWKNIGRLYLNQKAHKEAIKYFETAICFMSENPDDQLNLFEYMNKAYTGNGNEKQAFIYLNKVLELKDSLYHKNQYMFNRHIRENLELREKVTRQKLETEVFRNRVIGLVALVLGLLALVTWLAYRDVQRKHREKSLEIDALIRSSDIRYINEVESQMDKIATGLHAEIGNCGYFLNMAAASLHQNLTNQPALQEQASQLQGYIKESFSELRHLSHSLGTTVLEKTGLVTVIKETIQKLTNHSGVNITFTPIGHQTAIGFDVSRNLYRIIQNLLNNSLVHGAPKNIKINLSAENGQLTMLYSDDGKGFDTDNYKPGAGIQDIGRMANAIHAKYEWVEPPEFGKGKTMYLTVSTSVPHERNQQN